MKDVRKCFVGVFAGVALVAGGSGAAPAAETWTSHATATAEFAADSPEAMQIRQWLVARKAPSGPGDALRFAPGDRVTITRRAVTTGGGVVASASVPIPLPAVGQPGESRSVTHTGGGWVQSWSYEWTAGAWQLVAYRIDKADAGPAG